VEFVVLAVVAAIVAAYIAFPRAAAPTDDADTDELHEQHRALLRQLRELDEDLAAGRISADDRAAGRRALGPPLRTVTEALRDRGEST
jgi:predicted aminopeptidase